jgi:hypothetical protein
MTGFPRMMLDGFRLVATAKTNRRARVSQKTNEFFMPAA